MANGNQDELERLLDVALARYTAEPRAGLEERVLANLRAETQRGSQRAWWGWSALALVAAALVIATALSWKLDRPMHSPTRVAVTTAPAMEPAKKQVTTSEVRSEVQSEVRSKVRNQAQSKVHLRAGAGASERLKHHAPQAVPVAAQPKLDQFPSPQPLSEQELALARYVNQFPREAELIARAQEEFDREIQQQMKNADSHTEGPDSDEKER